jgi:hypothetical protein
LRTLSSNQEAKRTDQDKSVFWFLRVDWPEPYGVRYYSERVFSPDTGVDSEPLLLGFPTIARDHELDALRALSWNEYSVSFQNLPQNEDNIQTLVDSLGTVTGVPVDMYMIMEPESGSVTSSDWILLGSTRIVDYDISATKVVFGLRDFYVDPGRQRLSREFLREDWPLAAGKVLGDAAPYIFGEVAKVPLPVIQGYPRTNLAAAMTAAQTTATVDDTSDFPSAGSLFIGGEEMSYTGTTPTTFTGLTRGITGTTAVIHASGDSVLESDQTTPFRVFVADHVCISVSNVLVDGLTVNLNAPVVTTDTWGDRTIQVVDLTWSKPVVGGVMTFEDYRDSNVTGDVQGYEDPYEAPSGQVMIKVENVIRFLVESSDFFGLDPSRLNLSVLQAALADAGSDTWRFDRRIYTRPRKFDLLNEAVWAGGIRMGWENGQLHAFASLVPDAAEAGYEFVRDDMMSEATRTFEHDARIVNKLRLYYDRQWSGSDTFFAGRYLVEDQFSQEADWGIQQRSVFAEWINDPTSADELSTRLLAQNAWRRAKVKFEGPLNWVRSEQGDVVTVLDTASGMNNTYGVVTGTKFPFPDFMEMDISLVDRRTRIWDHLVGGNPDDLNFIDVFSSPLRMVFSVDGGVVAVLSESGKFFIKGEIKERTFPLSGGEIIQTPADSATGHVEWQDNAGTGEILFGVTKDTSTDVVNVMRLDGNGDLYVYVVRETDSYPLTAASSPTFAYYYEWFDSLASLDFTSDLQRTFFRLTRIDVGGEFNGRLFLKEVRENAL